MKMLNSRRKFHEKANIYEAFCLAPVWNANTIISFRVNNSKNVQEQILFFSVLLRMHYRFFSYLVFVFSFHRWICLVISFKIY